MRTALVLTEENAAEIMTTFRRHRLTDSWTASGGSLLFRPTAEALGPSIAQAGVKALSENLAPGPSCAELPRKVQTTRMYEAMGLVGLNYGPDFQLLQDMRASTTEPLATAKATNTRADKTKYHLHPTLLDAALQLIGFAGAKGRLRLAKLRVPTVVEELSIYRCASDIDLTVSAELMGDGGAIGSGQCMADGNTVLCMSGVRLAAMEDGERPDKRTDTQADCSLRMGATY